MARPDFWLTSVQEVLNASTQVAIIAAGLDSMITIFNSGAERMLGYPASEMVGKQSPLVFHLASEVEARGEELSRKFGRPVEGLNVFVEYALQGGYEDREWTYVRKDGSHVPVRLVITAVRYAAGELAGFLGVAVDITEQTLHRKRLAESLENTQRLFSAFMEHLPAAAFIKDSSGRYLYLNPYASARKPSGMEEEMSAQDRQVFATNQPLTARAAIPTAAGVRHFEAVKFPIPGKEVLLGGFAFDITEKLEAEAALAQRRAMLQLIIENIPGAVSYIDQESRYRFANRAHAELVGRPPGSYIGLTVADVLGPALYGEWRPRLEAMPDGRSRVFDLRRSNPDGEIRHLQVMATPHLDERGEFRGAFFLVIDVTERHELEEALRARESQLRTITDNLPGTVSYVDADQRYRFANSAHQRWFGIEADDYLGRKMSDVVPPWFLEKIQPRVEEVLSGRAVTFDLTESVQPGRNAFFQVSFVPHFGENGQVLGFFSLGTDVTARHDLELSLRESDARANALIDTAAVGILLAGTDGVIVTANLKATELFGYAKGELAGKPVEDLLPEALRNLHRQHRADYFEAPRTRPMGINLELRGLRKDGTEFPVEVGLSHSGTGAGQIAVAFVHDITQRKQYEARLRTLAGQLLTVQEEERRSIARELHDDLTQQIATLGIELGLVLQDLPQESQALRRSLEAIRSRIESLSEDVRSLSHQLHPSALEHAGLEAALEGHCAEFARVTGIRTVLSVRGKVPALSPACNAVLYRIAQEALRNVAKHSGAKRAQVTLTTDDAQVRLSIIDDGCGFELSHGTSPATLGIVSMQERARLAGGDLLIHSEPGEGTRVEVRVPVTGSTN